jgi:uncharacterized membrane protein
MNKQILDFIGQASWVLMFVAPVIGLVFGFTGKTSDRLTKVLTSLAVSVAISIVCLFVAVSILLRDGLGPG